MSKKHTTESLHSKLHALKAVRLSEQEHSAMKSQLLSYADLHAAPDLRPSVLSPFSYKFSYKSLQYSSRFVFSGALALLLLVGSTGVSFAAENTLPGQPLYSVKVNVTEPAESAIISVTSGKAGEAEWQNTLAARRLQEASELSDKNELASSTQVYLAQQVATHIDASQEDSAELAESGATSTAIAAQTDLVTRLSVHKRVLALLLQDTEQNHIAFGLDASTTDLAIASTTIDGESDALAADSTSTPMLAITTDTDTQTHIEEAHALRQEFRALNVPRVATTSTTTASSTEETASTTASTTASITASSTATTTVSTTTPAHESPFMKLLEFLQK